MVALLSPVQRNNKKSRGPNIGPTPAGPFCARAEILFPAQSCQIQASRLKPVLAKRSPDADQDTQDDRRQALARQRTGQKTHGKSLADYLHHVP